MGTTRMVFDEYFKKRDVLGTQMFSFNSYDLKTYGDIIPEGVKVLEL